MKKVILTGASGFIGRHVLGHLLKNKFEVHAIFFNHKPEYKDEKNLVWHKCNILDYSLQEKLFTAVKPSHMIHLAWYTVPGKYWTSPENLRWVQASLNLITNFSKNGGLRAVAAGSCAEYDWQNGFCSEMDTPLKPASLYGVCKSSLENILNQFSIEAGFSCAWGRIFHLFGPHENPERLVSSVLRAMINKETVRCTHGNQIRDFLYVEDVASAFVSLLMSDIRGPINIASNQPKTVREVVLAAADCLGAKGEIQFGALASPANEPRMIVGDNRRITEEVGWHPQFDLNSGLMHMVRTWRGENFS